MEKLETIKETRKLKVWWIPQVPMKAFNVKVSNLKEARLLLDTLANYDQFQLDNKIKPDYCNMGGLSVWIDDLEPDEDGSRWTDWYDEETGLEFDEFCEMILEK